MKGSLYYIISFITTILFFVAICILSLRFYVGGDRKDNKVNYESLYFLNDSLVNGAAVIEAINYFSGKELMILVKTKKEDQSEVYNWDGKKHIKGYSENKDKLESNYINRSALFRVNMEKDNDRIVCVRFYQE